ncbi:MAG: peptidylprolyl isomerase [Acidobacteriota bacterium]|nr:peptidylprolyl isomerase [Acidobacteriota bacterium]
MYKKNESILVTILIGAICICVPWVAGSPLKPIPKKDLVRIFKAEDELLFDKTLIDYLKGKNTDLVNRAALAAGRIGDEAALPLLADLVADKNAGVAQTAVFAIGEIGSVKGSAAVQAILRDTANPDTVRARALEAAGKIAATTKDSAVQSDLGESILDNLEFELRRGKEQSRLAILLGITAVIRSKPVDGDYVLSKFLTNLDGRIRADAANAVARLGSKRLNRPLQSMLLTDDEPLARANSARALGVSGDVSAINLLLTAAITDEDSRVRTNALNAVGAIADKAIGPRLLERAESLLDEYKRKTKAGDINELLTIAGAIGRTMQGSNDVRSIKFLNDLRGVVGNSAPESETALVRVSAGTYLKEELPLNVDWRETASKAAALGLVAELEESADAAELKAAAEGKLKAYLASVRGGKTKPNLSYSSVLAAYGKHKPADLARFLREALLFEDVVVRETAARLLGEQELPGGNSGDLENYNALRDAFLASENDKLNDATLSSLEGLKNQYLKLKGGKYAGPGLLEPFKLAAGSPDYLVRRKAHDIAEELGLKLPIAVDKVRFGEKGNARLIRANYERAATRKKAAAVLTTTKGEFRIEFFPQAAPLTVENFVNLAKSGYFNGLAIHRVVPNFVVQDGDPRGDGSGGPGWHIRCEINEIGYERGSVGMALSGKDTGGSQWFVAHSPQPHLDGGYTVFGKVNEENMLVVDRLARGDIIKKIEILE